MARDNVVQARLSDSEYETVETVAEEFTCSDAEALRKCIRVVRVYEDEELVDMMNSEEFEAVTRLMGQ